MMEKKKLPIGVEFFKEFKSDDFYYVDKTGFISELLRTRGTVNLKDTICNIYAKNRE